MYPTTTATTITTKEAALRHCYHCMSEALKEHYCPLAPLTIGDRCYIQNQAGNHPKRWDRSGLVVDVLSHDSYLVKVNGFGRLTQRNRRLLRKFVPVSPPTPNPIPILQNGVSDPRGSGRSPSDRQPHHSHHRLPRLRTTKMKLMTRLLVPERVNPTARIPQPTKTAQAETTDEHVQFLIPSRPRRTAIPPPLTYEPESGKWMR